MPVTKKDLPTIRGRKLPGGGYVEPVRPLLFCRCCGNEYSASPGDYWNATPNDVLTCDDCGEPLELARKLIAFVPWAQGAALRSLVLDACQWPAPLVAEKPRNITTDKGEG